MAEEVSKEWKEIVDRVICAWSGYQLGIDFSSGGPDTLAKDEWFKEVVAEYILTTRGLKADDLEEWLNNVLYTEFNLILEDESVYPTSAFLLEALGYFKHNDRVRLDQMVASLPSSETVREVNRKSRPECSDEEEDMEMDDISENSENEPEPTDTARRERPPRTVTDEDGWTTILKK
uniref:Pre-rRNA-processing protein TSR2 homolog n=1 Tax=Haemonchus contortus TaxID=6289 RepID=A0A7I4YSY5_HAECO|nr:Pre-rRNA-processing protein TSR2 domain containing protein [Haemonchus contortus]